jgi:hypothetical protein
MTETKEQTPLEKLQVEYNQLCALDGHLTQQIKTFIKQRQQNRDRLEKITNKAANISKADQEASKVKAPEIPREIAEEAEVQSVAS